MVDGPAPVDKRSANETGTSACPRPPPRISIAAERCPTPTMPLDGAPNAARSRTQPWLVRKPGEHGIPSTIGKVAEQISADVADLRELARLLPPDEYAVRLAVGTNTLIDNPGLAAHVGMLGRRYMAHLLPVVLREIDDLKRGGKTQQLREAYRRTPLSAVGYTLAYQYRLRNTTSRPSQPLCYSVPHRPATGSRDRVDDGS